MSAKRVVLYGFGIVTLALGSVALGVLTAPKPRPQANNQAPLVASQGVIASEQTGSAANTNAIPLSVKGSATVQGTASGTAPNRYSETYNGVSMQVTNQVAPDNFSNEPAVALKALASGMKASEPVAVSGWGTCYVAPSAEVEVGMCASSSRLVVIQAFGNLSAQDWSSYLAGIAQ